MMHSLLILLFLNNINCSRLSGYFKLDYFASAYITPNNNFLYFEQENKRLYMSEPENNSSKYQSSKSITKKNFPTKSIPKNVYYDIRNLKPYNKIEVNYFNESHLSNFIHNETNFDYISLEDLGDNTFIFLKNAAQNSGKNNTINIAYIDFLATTANKKIKINKTYTLEDEAKRINTYCISTSNKNIVCGLIVKSEDDEYYYYNKSLILINNKKDNISDRIYMNEDDYIEKYEDYDDYDYDYDDYDKQFEDEYNKTLIYKFFKLVPLKEERIFYCFTDIDGNIKCGLIQIENDSTIKELIEPKFFYKSYDFYSNFAKNSFSALKYKNENVALCLVEKDKITIQTFEYDSNNNKLNIIIDKKTEFPESFYNYIYYSKLLKNNNDELILFVINGYSASTYALNGFLQELEYSSCSDYYYSLYNSDRKEFSLTVNPSILEDKLNSYSIYFFNDGNEINSIFKDINKNETISENEAFSTKIKFYFNLSYLDYDYVKLHNNEYKLKFSRSKSDTRNIQKCTITFNIYRCKKAECKYCNSDNKCWDAEWNPIYFKTSLEKSFWIIPVAIGVMLIVLLFFSLAKCCIREQIPNLGGENLIQNEMPLIT